MDTQFWNQNQKVITTLTKPFKSASTLLANKRVRIIPQKCVHVRRALSGKGSLRIAKNQEITPADILGYSTVNAGFAAVNLARALGVSPGEALQYLQRPIGKTIFKGELLGFKKGLLGKKIVTAPTDGLIENYDPKSGELKIKYISKEIPLTAGVYGIVDDINIQNGEVLIKSLVTEIYGIYGSGKERSGTMEIIGGRGDLLSAASITPKISKHIIVSGGLIYGSTLRKAAGYGVYGIVGGGYNVSDYRSITGTLSPQNRLGTDVGLSILATEGFGSVPIGEDIFNEIKKHDGQFVFINGNMEQLLLPSPSSDSILALRKISLPVLAIGRVGSIKPETKIAEIKVGDTARIIWPPYMGAQGKVEGIDKTATVLESGISTYLLTLATPTAKIKVPYPNVEII